MNNFEFLEIARTTAKKKQVELRKTSFIEIYDSMQEDELAKQASRCLECGNPYCQWKCPLHNYIPSWLKLASEGKVLHAAELCYESNPLPEICGRVCPQEKLCEGACTLNADFGAVTIGMVEKTVTDTAFALGWRPDTSKIKPLGKKVAIVGAGPAGIGCADTLARAGVECKVFDKRSEIGGLLTFGIPEFKLEKTVIKRRRKILESLNINFALNTEVGKDVLIEDLLEQYDAVFLGMGTYDGMKGNFAGENLTGVYQALDYLEANINNCLGIDTKNLLDLKGKKVVVLGGGDTAMDCTRTAIRQGAEQVICAYRRDEANMPGSKKEVENAKEEGVEFLFNSQPIGIVGKDKVEGIKFVGTRLGEADASGRRAAEVIPNSEQIVLADACILAFGFNANPPQWLEKLGVNTDNRGRILTNGAYAQQTDNSKIFAGGDAVRGSDLVVTAVAEGKKAAKGILNFLTA